ncbi:MAG: transposase [Chloroflexi bacterium]|nr:transposase [Chloroflexota bacterium]
MLTLPAVFIPLLLPFQPLFHPKTWAKAQCLLQGAILTPGKRTVTAALRVLGLAGDRDFAKYHHVISTSSMRRLNRAHWSPRQVSQTLLRLLLDHLDSGSGPLVFGLDETLERRWGKRIRARGIYRDAVRSSHTHISTSSMRRLVKASGLRWVSLMWLAPIPWANRVWALPILTALAPSERFYRAQGRQAKKLTDWARQMILQLRRWLPQRALVVVGDASYAALELLHFCQALRQPVTVVTRLRLDAALYAPAAPRQPGQRGRPRGKGVRLPTFRQAQCTALQARLQDSATPWQAVVVPWYDGQQRALEIASDTALWYHSGLAVVPLRWVLIRDPLGELRPQALLCTDQETAPAQIVAWFVQRWQGEVTFQEGRAHLGLETQRQWSDQAIARATPALLGLFSWVTLAAQLLQETAPFPSHSAAWYAKPLPTFSDALGLVRQRLWFGSENFCMSPARPDVAQIPRSLFARLIDTLCYAA